MRIVFAIALFVATARAGTRVGADVDLNTVAELGGSLWVTAKPDATPRWRFGAGGFFTGVPSVFVDLDARNKGEGWTVRPRGVLAFAEWYPDRSARGFYVGAYVGWVRIQYTRDAMAGVAAVDHASFEPHVGYQWYPFASGFYVQPWLGFAILPKTGGSSTVGDQTYAERPIVPLYGLNVGYER